MDARGHKRAACAALGRCARDAMLALSVGAPVDGGTGSDRARAITAYDELAQEMERRGVAVHRAPDPTPDAPALPFPDSIERVETDRAAAENG